MQEKVYNVLFLCTGNAAHHGRSLVDDHGQGSLQRLFGRQSSWRHCQSLRHRASGAYGRPNAGAAQQIWDEFGAEAPHIDVIITVCDNAACEMYPHWAGHPMSAHWGFEDPAAALVNSVEETRAVFNRIFRQIMARMTIFISLPLHMLEKNAIQREIHAIGPTST